MYNASYSLGSRPLQSIPRKRTGACFLFAVVFLIAFLYIGYISILIRPFLYPLTHRGIFLFFFFHLFFVLLCLAFCKCIATDPGAVPANWGFYMGDDTKRRRYCKVCNVWKPDRTHHCSACGRCVLNMDHHCPWINNCVGFYNRKFFLQLLLYALSCLSFVTIHSFQYLLNQPLNLFDVPTPIGHTGVGHEFKEHFPSGYVVAEYIYVCVMLCVSIILIFALVPFSKFHISLVLRNSTTVENMDIRNRDVNRYDLGATRNIEQVFGVNPFCWLAPCHSYSSRPVGDGVRWNMHYAHALDCND